MKSSVGKCLVGRKMKSQTSLASAAAVSTGRQTSKATKKQKTIVKLSSNEKYEKRNRSESRKDFKQEDNNNNNSNNNSSSSSSSSNYNKKQPCLHGLDIDNFELEPSLTHHLSFHGQNQGSNSSVRSEIIHGDSDTIDRSNGTHGTQMDQCKS